MKICAKCPYVAHVTGPCELGTVHPSRPCGIIQYVTLLGYPIRELIPPIRSVDNLMALAICPMCHTPISVASGQCDVLEKVRSLVSIGGDMPCDVLEGRGWCWYVYPELR